jgi:ribosomal protein S18 acetylase RimI-like enzyme
MRTAMDVRIARPDELAAAGEVAFAAYDAAGLLPASVDYGAVLRDAAGRATAADVLVAVVGEAVVGTVTYIGGDSPLREIARDGEAEFRMLGVAPEGQGAGVGVALVERVVAMARRQGCESVVCSSRTTMHAAHRLYARLGFVRAPERDWSPVAGVDLLGFTLELR